MYKSTNTQTNYLESAIQGIYRGKDDFILLGLTGRTGSGCSTAARILTSHQDKINHSLFTGNNPQNNEQRKQRIIYHYFKKKWVPFTLIQVRSIITTFLLDHEIENVSSKFGSLLPSTKEKTNLIRLLNNLKEDYIKIDPESDPGLAAIFYTETLPKKCDEIKKIFGENQLVRFYQEIGKNIRISGNPYEPNLVSGKFFSLARRINDVIKAIHNDRQRKGEPTYIAIDAIRSPLEAIYFQDIYSAFYLVAISAPEPHRLQRLRRLHYSETDIALLDETEYSTRKLDDPKFFSVQDIQGCLQRADLYIDNAEAPSEVNKFQELANQLIKFVSLIRRPGIVTPSAEERCMQIAYTAKLNSGCISRQVGAVVTDQNYSIRSIGWNDTPFGQVPCNLRNRDDLLSGMDSEAYSEYERTDERFLKFFHQRSVNCKLKDTFGRNNSYCFKTEYNKYTEKDNQVHTRALHAEENAFLQISKYGLASVEGGKLFTTASPCELCAKKAYQLGIKEIIFIDPYPGIAVSHVLRGGGCNPKLRLFSGAIGRAFHQLYSQVVPYKDELAALQVTSWPY